MNPETLQIITAVGTCSTNFILLVAIVVGIRLYRRIGK